MTELPPRTESELIELVRSSDVRAPDSLHRQVATLVASRRRRRLALHPPVLGTVAAAVVVVVVVALAIALGGGGSPGPSLRQAAAPTLRAATLPAPPESSANHAQLATAVDGVPFPYWEDRFGWRSTGTRSDRIDGRTVTTVFYSDAAGRRIGYAILAGTPAPRINGGVVTWRGGVPYRLLTANGAAVVTWLRDGRLCVVSGRGVSSATLLKLASWSARDASAS
jgi:hypothetical protein